MFDRLGELASEHAELERALADPGVHADADQARTLAKRYGELTPIVNAYLEWQQIGEDEQAALELATEDSAFGQEAVELATAKSSNGSASCSSQGSGDDRDTILESRRGGDESPIRNDLRMYQRFAERHGWSGIIDSTVTGLGGVKTTVPSSEPERHQGWSRLKYQAACRVQRVPVTESQGRIHLRRGRARHPGPT